MDPLPRRGYPPTSCYHSGLRIYQLRIFRTLGQLLGGSCAIRPFRSNTVVALAAAPGPMAAPTSRTPHPCTRRGRYAHSAPRWYSTLVRGSGVDTCGGCAGGFWNAMGSHIYVVANVRFLLRILMAQSLRVLCLSGVVCTNTFTACQYSIGKSIDMGHIYYK